MTDETLKERYSPEGSDLRKLQLRMLEILNEVEKFVGSIRYIIG